MQLFDLTDKNVLITGGTRGIGFAIAQGVKQAGGRVWIHGSSEDRTRRIAEENGFDYLYGDLRDQEGLDGMLRPFLTREDRLDVLINNAGFETHSAIENAEEESMDAIYNVNTKSPYFLLQKLLPALKKEHIFVRYFSKERISNYLRISIGTKEEMEELIRFLKNYLQ